jgi:nanoRNase/pAp phosphatase (c-di-AMP/oligoRNAs hydrolase)
VTADEDGGAEFRPLLIVVSETPTVLGKVRSYDRSVVRWQPDLATGRDGDGFGGDPTDSAAFEWARDAIGVTAVIDLPPVRARATLHALRRVRPDAAVLLLSDELADMDHARDGTLARGGSLRDVLRLDLDEELERLEAERRVFCLRAFVEGAAVVPIVIHDNPDPDAVSSAFGISVLVDGSPERTPIVSLGPIMRPENRRMVELLRIRVTTVSLEELRRFERIITVDTQPRELQQDGMPRLAVIDHHPLESGYTAEFRDIRPAYGATATMITEYLRAAMGRTPGRGLATALLYGIKTDTDSLMRGVTPADVAAYAYLQEHADLNVVRRFERPSYAGHTAQALGRALASVNYDDDLCVAYMGELDADEGHVLADLADFCLAIENVTWVAAAALLEGELVLTLRHAGGSPGAGAVAREVAKLGGSGGGHATMARVTLPRATASDLVGGEDAEVVDAIRRLLRDVLERVESVSRPGSRPVPQASGPAGSSR